MTLTEDEGTRLQRQHDELGEEPDDLQPLNIKPFHVPSLSEVRFRATTTTSLRIMHALAVDEIERHPSDWQANGPWIGQTTTIEDVLVDRARATNIRAISTLKPLEDREQAAADTQQAIAETPEPNDWEARQARNKAYQKAEHDHEHIRELLTTARRLIAHAFLLSEADVNTICDAFQANHAEEIDDYRPF